MIKFDEWVLPAHEKHLQGWMTKMNRREDGRLTYQYHKYEASESRCRQKRCAVDIGAHVGLMAYWMARDFETVHAFEPVAEHRDCFTENMRGVPAAITLHACALGERDDMISIRTAPGSSGDSSVAGPGDIPQRRLDDFGLADVDLIKIDAEGYEEKIVRGAVETIKTWRPVILVEQKRDMAGKYGLARLGAVTALVSLGYRIAAEIGGDFLCVPR